MKLDLNYLFEPKNIAIFGASKHPNNVGGVILKNFLDGGFTGKVFPINPKYDTVMGLPCKKTVLEIKEKIDCAIIATPASTIPGIIEQCGKKGIKAAIVISGGFKEVGNEELEERIVSAARRHAIALLGPNCIGIYNPSTRVDSIFLPLHKLGRPNPGDIAFVTQSGAVGGAIIDIAAHYNVGISKFISYGNAAMLDEVDFLNYLENDPSTKRIIVYVEGVKRGREFFEALKRINRKKPIVVLKAGKHKISSIAAKSHTGNIAGDYLVYKTVFKKANVLEAETLEELFDFVRIFNQPLPMSDSVAVITNGGGMGVLTMDAIEEIGLKAARFSEKSLINLKNLMPKYGNIDNPLDLIADANEEMYKKVIDVFMNDENVGGLIIVVLFQTPPAGERLINVLVEASDDERKPIAVIAVGGGYTDANRRILERYGVPTYGSPSAAVKSFKKLCEYAKNLCLSH